jgi:hypothetical protein
MDWAAQLNPAYAAARAEVRRLSMGEDGTLSVIVKELIVPGILASRGLQYGMKAHMRRALDYGATKEELFEAIKAAAAPGGGVAYSVGGPRPPGAGAGRGLRAAQPASSRVSSAGERRPSPARLPPHTAPAKHRRAAVTVPDTWRPEGDCPARYVAVGQLTSARHTRLLRTGAFSGSVPLGISRSLPCGA